MISGLNDSGCNTKEAGCSILQFLPVRLGEFLLKFCIYEKDLDNFNVECHVVRACPFWEWKISCKHLVLHVTGELTLLVKTVTMWFFPL